MVDQRVSDQPNKETESDFQANEKIGRAASGFGNTEISTVTKFLVQKLDNFNLYGVYLVQNLVFSKRNAKDDQYYNVRIFTTLKSPLLNSEKG